MIDFDKKTYKGKKYRIMDVIVNGVSVDNIIDIVFRDPILILMSASGNLFDVPKNELTSFYATFMDEDNIIIEPKEINITEDIYRYITVRQIADDIAENYIIDNVDPNEHMIEMEIHDALYKFRTDIKETVIAILDKHRE